MLYGQIEDLTVALADAMALPHDLVVLASIRAFLTLRDVLQELDASPIARCHDEPPSITTWLSGVAAGPRWH